MSTETWNWCDWHTSALLELSNCWYDCNDSTPVIYFLLISLQHKLMSVSPTVHCLKCYFLLTTDTFCMLSLSHGGCMGLVIKQDSPRGDLVITVWPIKRAPFGHYFWFVCFYRGLSRSEGVCLATVVSHVTQKVMIWFILSNISHALNFTAVWYLSVL